MPRLVACHDGDALLYEFLSHCTTLEPGKKPLPVHTVEPLLPCCIPEVYENAPLSPLGSVPVQVEGKGGQLLGRIAEREHYKLKVYSF